MMKEHKKGNLKTFRFPLQIEKMLSNASRQMQLTEENIVQDAIFNYLENKENFLCCPCCQAYIYPKELIPSGTAKFSCNSCDATIVYDSDADKILDYKK